jgi:hypothetical protein
MSKVKLQEVGFTAKIGMGNVHPAVLAVWAAIIAVAHMLPSIPMVGVGGTFSVSSALIPLAGVFFGPIAGAICAAIGSFIGQMVAPHTAWLGIATFLLGTLTAFIAGCVIKGKWPLVVVIMAIGTALWFTQEIGRQVPFFAIVFYGLGAIMAIIGGIYGRKFIKGNNLSKKFIAIWLASFAGMAGTAAIANYFTLILFELPATAWLALVPISPIQRAIFSIGAAVIGVPLLIGLPKIGVFVGPDSDLSEDDD